MLNVYTDFSLAHPSVLPLDQDKDSKLDFRKNKLGA